MKVYLVPTLPGRYDEFLTALKAESVKASEFGLDRWTYASKCYQLDADVILDRKLEIPTRCGLVIFDEEWNITETKDGELINLLSFYDYDLEYRCRRGRLVCFWSVKHSYSKLYAIIHEIMKNKPKSRTEELKEEIKSKDQKIQELEKELQECRLEIQELEERLDIIREKLEDKMEEILAMF